MEARLWINAKMKLNKMRETNNYRIMEFSNRAAKQIDKTIDIIDEAIVEFKPLMRKQINQIIDSHFEERK